MKRQLTILPAALIAFLLMILVPGVSAQDVARADIPFAFAANHHVLPAGCYQVELQLNAVVMLTNCATGKTVGVMVHTANGYPRIGYGSLVFRATPRGYRLIHVRFARTNIQSDLSVQQLRSERQLAWNAASKSIEVAMR